MARYVRTDELLKTARDGYHSDFGRSMADLTSLREVIEDTPTADVVECKHGEWSVKKHSCSKFITCSVCNGTIGSHAGIDETKFKYCPFCGAKMDGGK